MAMRTAIKEKLSKLNTRETILIAAVVLLASLVVVLPARGYEQLNCPEGQVQVRDYCSRNEVPVPPAGYVTPEEGDYVPPAPAEPTPVVPEPETTQAQSPSCTE